MYLSDYSAKSSSDGHFVGRAVNGRVPFCEPFQATHLQGPGSHPRSCCCATSFSNKFTHNHYTSSLTSLHVAAAFQQPNPPLPNVGIGIVLLLSLLVIHLGPLGSSPSECKSRFREVILHEKSMIDWGLAGVIPSFIVVFWAYHLQWPQTRVTSEKSLPFQSLCKVFLQQLNLRVHLPRRSPPPQIWNNF